jgi:hypothetical protein
VDQYLGLTQAKAEFFGPGNSLPAQLDLSPDAKLSLPVDNVPASHYSFGTSALEQSRNFRLLAPLLCSRIFATHEIHFILIFMVLSMKIMT